MLAYAHLADIIDNERVGFVDEDLMTCCIQMRQAYTYK